MKKSIKGKIALLSVASILAASSAAFAAECPIKNMLGNMLGGNQNGYPLSSLVKNGNLSDSMKDLCEKYGICIDLSGNLGTSNGSCPSCGNSEECQDCNKDTEDCTDCEDTSENCPTCGQNQNTENNTNNQTQQDTQNNNQEQASEENKDTAISEYAQEVVRLVNEERAKNGLSALTIDYTAAKAADVRAGEIESYFSHTRPDGSSCFTALSQAGVSYMGAGENIAKGQRTPAEVMNGWMNSSGHRANILNAKFTKIGVSYKMVNGTPCWVQLFTY